MDEMSANSFDLAGANVHAPTVGITFFRFCLAQRRMTALLRKTGQKIISIFEINNCQSSNFSKNICKI